MNVNQIATLINTIGQEQTGEIDVVAEDLSNIVQVGNTLVNVMGVDGFTSAIANKIGRTIFVSRDFDAGTPNIARESWEWGSILEKVRVELPDAVANPSWELVAGESIDPFIYNPPEVSAKYYNGKTTFEIDMSFTEIQVRQSLRSPAEFTRFINSIEARVRVKLKMSKHLLAMRTINGLIAECVHADQVINLKDAITAAGLTPVDLATDIMDSDKLAVMANVILNVRDKLKHPSTLFAGEGYVTYTPEEFQRCIILDALDNAFKTHLYSGAYHDDYLKYGDYDTVPYWQGSGNTIAECFDIETNASINVKLPSDNTVTVDSATDECYILGTVFDRDAAAICNDNPRVTSIYNPRGEYTNYFYKEDCSYIIDRAENAIVFVYA